MTLLRHFGQKLSRPPFAALLGACLLAGCGESQVHSGAPAAIPRPQAAPAPARAVEKSAAPVAPANRDVRPAAPARGAAGDGATGPELSATATVPAAQLPAPPSRPPGESPAAGDRVFKTEGPDGAVRVSYDDLDLLKVLKMDPVTPDAAEKMPAWLRQLHGKRVRIRGFMYPPFQETGIPKFVLARDNQICCFGRNPKIYDLIEVTMQAGTTTDYIQGRPFDVVGKFRIELGQLEDGMIFGLYYIDNASVIAH